MGAISATILDGDYSIDDDSGIFRIGFVVLSTDLTLEPDMRRLLPPFVYPHITRVEFINPLTPENLRHMAPDISAAASLILTDEPLSALCYACTSASALLGDDVISSTLQAGKPNTPVTNPALAGAAALAALGGRVSLLSPYPAAVSQPLADYLTAKGSEVVSHHCLNIDDDRAFARFNPDSLIDIAVRACDASADAIFLPCTNLPAVSIIERLEQKLGRAVITSNQAMLWMALRLAGCDYTAPHGGKLFTLDLPDGFKN